MSRIKTKANSAILTPVLQREDMSRKCLPKAGFFSTAGKLAGIVHAVAPSSLEPPSRPEQRLGARLVRANYEKP